MHLTVSRSLLFLLIFSLPLFFLPFTLDPLELNKQTILVLLTCSAALTWIGGILVQKKFSLRRERREWLLLLPLFPLLTFGISAWYSSSSFLSWIGGEKQEYTSVLTLGALVLLFYLCRYLFHDKQTQHLLSLLMITSAVIASAVTLFSLFGLSLPFSFAFPRVFNTVGTMNAAAIYLIAVSGFATVLFLSGKREKWYLQILSLFLLALTYTTLLINDYGMLWMIFLISQVLILIFGFFRVQDFSSSRFLVPVLFCFASLPFWFWLPSPFRFSLPIEVSPSFEASQTIAQKTFERFPETYGSGPGTYVFDFASFHGPQVNVTDFFNSRFDRAASYYLTLLPTVGYLGLISLLLFFFTLAIRAIAQILTVKRPEEWLHLISFFVPWMTLVIAGALFAFNLTIVFTFFLFSGLLSTQLSDGASHPTKSRPAVMRFISISIFCFGALALLVGIFFTSQRYVAEAAFAQAVRADRTASRLEDVVFLLDKAATLNQYDDRFYRVLSEALLLRTKEELRVVGQDISAEKKQYLQGLVAASVNASVRATELSSRNITNWLMRCTVYRELLAMVPNADVFARESCTRVTELEPVNPFAWSELGKVYLVIAKKKQPLTVSTNKEVAAQAAEERSRALEDALAAFGKAVELKANYAPAHFQLGLVYEAQGRLDDAIGKMESVARYNTTDVGVAFQLGQLYLRRSAQGDLDRAKDALEHTVELAPSFSNARWFLASIYEQKGDIKSAIEHVEKVLALNPDNTAVKARLDRLLKGKAEKNLPAPIE